MEAVNNFKVLYESLESCHNHLHYNLLVIGEKGRLSGLFLSGQLLLLLLISVISTVAGNWNLRGAD